MMGGGILTPSIVCVHCYTHSRLLENTCIMVAPAVPDFHIDKMANVIGGTLQQDQACRLPVYEISPTWHRGIDSDMCSIHGACTLGKTQYPEAIHDLSSMHMCWRLMTARSTLH